MESDSEDRILEYFKVGAPIEINSKEEGLDRSWFEGTVIRPPKGGSPMVLVEYDTLMADKAGTRPLRELLEVGQLRPRPPRENRHFFKLCEEVDAFLNGGWWEGIIIQVVEDLYKVHFRGTREKLFFKASHLRLHREWADEMWFPPLEEPQRVAMPTDDEQTPFFSEVEEANNEVIEHNFNPGDLVETSTDDEGFEGAWFPATVLKPINNGKYLIEYHYLMNDDDTNFMREEVDGLHMRPCPPDIKLVDGFELYEKVDAFYNDCWWIGMISKVLKNDKYCVYFKTTDEELKFEHSDLRMHQEWRNGKWHYFS